MEEDITWPGYPDQKPAGVNISQHLHVVTIEETPFVYTYPLDTSDGCNETQLYNASAIARMECPRKLPNGTFILFIDLNLRVIHKFIYNKCYKPSVLYQINFKVI